MLPGSALLFLQTLPFPSGFGLSKVNVWIGSAAWPQRCLWEVVAEPSRRFALLEDEPSSAYLKPSWISSGWFAHQSGRQGGALFSLV